MIPHTNWVEKGWWKQQDNIDHHPFYFITKVLVIVALVSLQGLITLFHHDGSRDHPHPLLPPLLAFVSSAGLHCAFVCSTCNDVVWGLDFCHCLPTWKDVEVNDCSHSFQIPQLRPRSFLSGGRIAAFIVSFRWSPFEVAVSGKHPVWGPSKHYSLMTPIKTLIEASNLQNSGLFEHPVVSFTDLHLLRNEWGGTIPCCRVKGCSNQDRSRRLDGNLCMGLAVPCSCWLMHCSVLHSASMCR